METFPIVKRKDEQKYGEYRTKLVILECYDAVAEAGLGPSHAKWLIINPNEVKKVLFWGLKRPFWHQKGPFRAGRH